MFKVINGLIPRVSKGSRKGIEILPCLNSFHLLIKVHCVTWI